MKCFFNVIPLVSLLITSYFIYHGIYGNRGILRLGQINQEYAQEQEVYCMIRFLSARRFHNG